jgi:predicted amidophosphoribosyltransferase
MEIQIDNLVILNAKTVADYLFLRKLRNEVRFNMTGSIDLISLKNQVKFYISQPANIIIYIAFYKNKRAGYLLGQLIAHDIKANALNDQIDYIIPIPISNRKKRKRGFNQCQIICESILQTGVKATIFNGLLKTNNLTTQTHKDRQQRGISINRFFTLKNASVILNKQVLIVDDVLTTGATLEAAIISIQKACPAQIHIATAAYTIS